MTELVRDFHMVYFAKGGGGVKAAKPGGGQSIGQAIAQVVTGATGGSALNGTVGGKKGFQKGNKYGANRKGGTKVTAASGKHRSSQSVVAKHAKAGTLNTKEGHAALKVAADHARNLHAAKAEKAAEVKTARATASGRAVSLDAKATHVAGADKAAVKTAAFDAKAAKMQARVTKSVAETSAMKTDRAHQHLQDLHAGAKAGSLKAEDIHKQVDTIAKGATHPELKAAAAKAGVDLKGAKTKAQLVEKLKAHAAGQMKPGADKHEAIKKAPEKKVANPPEKKNAAKSGAVHDRIKSLHDEASTGKLSKEDLDHKLADSLKGATDKQVRDAATKLGIDHNDGQARGIRREVGRSLHDVASKARFAAEVKHLSAEVSSGRQTLEQAHAAASSWETSRALLVSHVEANLSKHAVPALAHHMTTTENFRSFEHGGVRYHAPDHHPVDASHPIIRQVEANLGSNLHPELSRHTSDVYFSGQRSSQDEHLAKTLSMPGFATSATGGDGRVVFYNGGHGDRGTLAHEMGHNLAKARLGNVTPHQQSDYARAMRLDKAGAPTEYGKTNAAEDFAESVYLHHADPTGFAASHPERASVIKRLLEDRHYGG